MKIESILTKEPVSVPGTKLNADFTINKSKHPSVRLSLEREFVMVELDGRQALIPLSNIICIILERKA